MVYCSALADHRELFGQSLRQRAITFDADLPDPTQTARSQIPEYIHVQRVRRNASVQNTLVLPPLLTG
jgi:hypothetical protein